MSKIVNKTELADIFGTSGQTIYNYTNEGMPVERQGAKGVEAEYDTADCIEWYAAKRHEKLNYNEERARLTKLQADKVRMEIDLLEGQTARMADITKAWEKALSELKSKLLAMPSNVAPHIIGITEYSQIEHILTQKVKDILNDVAS